MKLWNGKTNRTYIIYPVDPERPLYIDDDENIYYFDDDKKIFHIWCPASRLGYHLHNLQRIGVIK